MVSIKDLQVDRGHRKSLGDNEGCLWEKGSNDLELALVAGEHEREKE